MENEGNIGKNSIIPTLQQQARLGQRGIIIDNSADPSLLEQLPDIHQGNIRNGGKLIIDYAGNVDLHRPVVTQTSEKG